ncbi:hypothetical protein N7931_17170 [Catenovulum sp. 2E275]|uniref:hypothetical protein n=1 Tax=Catenovulum sp. 2E275 TaxID=2980497 RepID=UPI0021D2D95B|nr:hypothetical protein [Catenovulum sp. 2E275]MCU4677356.1 hypothetical protein [Catenovulum sp. 2E275]
MKGQTMKGKQQLKVLNRPVFLSLLMGMSFYSFSSLAAPYSMSFTLGQANTELGKNHVDILDSDKSDSSWGIEFGYDFELAKLKIGYIDLGEGSVTLQADSYTPEQYHETVKNVAPVLIEGVTIGAETILFENNNWFLNGQLGAVIWQNVIISQSDSGATYKSKERGTESYFGLSGGYQLTSNWSVSGQYRGYILSEYISDISIKLAYQF